jgi:hypothetical protein
MLDVQTSYLEASALAEQERRMRRMYSAVVMELIDVAIDDDILFSPDSKPTDGPDKIPNRRYNAGRDDLIRWADSADGHFILAMANIEPGPRTTKSLAAFVERGVRTAIALSSISRED